ncbi:putative quinol monooxygenase [Uliginosibacterium paludis]|uniref:Quinol monooxygenase n=1 Tax=Uliginosibacterium paludis TaxID=1615952 RepID=A0ABV2CQI8_9RHOO
MSIHVFASVTPKADQMDAAEAILREAVTASRQEPGCLRYDLFKSVQGEACFQFFETYADQAALAVHAQSAHFQTLKEKITPLLAQPIAICITTAVDAAG